jgi:hypothetical protein
VHNDQTEIEQAEEVLEKLSGTGKLTTLVMVQERLIQMRINPRYANTDAQSVLNDLLEWIKFPLSAEMSKVGRFQEDTYYNIPSPMTIGALEKVSPESTS